MSAWRKLFIIAVAMLATVAAVASGSESSGSGGEKGSGGSSESSESADTSAGDAGEVDDVKVNGCATDELGFASANITVTNDSADPSDYLIEITFASADGKTQIGTGNTIISNLANGQSKTEDVNSLEEAATGFTCTVSSVDRYSSV